MFVLDIKMLPDPEKSNIQKNLKSTKYTKYLNHPNLNCAVHFNFILPDFNTVCDFKSENPLLFASLWVAGQFFFGRQSSPT